MLDAALAIYVVIEHMLAGSVGAPAPGDVVSRLPAFLLLLQTGLTLRVMHTILFSVLVAGFWAVMLAVGLADPEIGAITSETIAHQAFGLLTFVAMSLFVIDGTLRLRFALREALRLEHERSALAASCRRASISCAAMGRRPCARGTPACSPSTSAASRP